MDEGGTDKVDWGQMLKGACVDMEAVSMKLSAGSLSHTPPPTLPSIPSPPHSPVCVSDHTCDHVQPGPRAFSLPPLPTPLALCLSTDSIGGSATMSTRIARVFTFDPSVNRGAGDAGDGAGSVKSTGTDPSRDDFQAAFLWAARRGDVRSLEIAYRASKHTAHTSTPARATPQQTETERGASWLLHATDKSSRTALILAAEYGRCEAVRSLVAMIDASCVCPHKHISARETHTRVCGDGSTQPCVVDTRTPVCTDTDVELQSGCEKTGGPLLSKDDMDAHTHNGHHGGGDGRCVGGEGPSGAGEDGGDGGSVHARDDGWEVEEGGTRVCACKRDILEHRDAKGKTALLAAAYYGHQEVVSLLLRSGAEVNAKDDLGNTVLTRAATGGNVVMATLALAYGADITITNNARFSALTYAALAGSTQVLQLLLDHHTNTHTHSHTHAHTAVSLVDEPDANGMKALRLAVKQGHVCACELLLSRGAQVDAKDALGYTGLMEAAISGHVDIADLLIKHGADIEATDPSHHTPLMLASREGQTPMVEMLVAHAGANVRAKNRRGSTAAHLARDDETRAVLRKHALARGISLSISTTTSPPPTSPPPLSPPSLYAQRLSLTSPTATIRPLPTIATTGITAAAAAMGTTGTMSTRGFEGAVSQAPSGAAETDGGGQQASGDQQRQELGGGRGGEDCRERPSLEGCGGGSTGRDVFSGQRTSGCSSIRQDGCYNGQGGGMCVCACGGGFVSNCGNIAAHTCVVHDVRTIPMAQAVCVASSAYALSAPLDGGGVFPYLLPLPTPHTPSTPHSHRHVCSSGSSVWSRNRDSDNDEGDETLVRVLREGVGLSEARSESARCVLRLMGIETWDELVDQVTCGNVTTDSLIHSGISRTVAHSLVRHARTPTTPSFSQPFRTTFRANSRNRGTYVSLGGGGGGGDGDGGASMEWMWLSWRCMMRCACVEWLGGTQQQEDDDGAGTVGGGEACAQSRKS